MSKNTNHNSHSRLRHVYDLSQIWARIQPDQSPIDIDHKIKVTYFKTYVKNKCVIVVPWQCEQEINLQDELWTCRHTVETQTARASSNLDG